MCRAAGKRVIGGDERRIEGSRENGVHGFVGGEGKLAVGIAGDELMVRVGFEARRDMLQPQARARSSRPAARGGRLDVDRPARQRVSRA
jgi:hypothetical protein